MVPDPELRRPHKRGSVSVRRVRPLPTSGSGTPGAPMSTSARTVRIYVSCTRHCASPVQARSNSPEEPEYEQAVPFWRRRDTNRRRPCSHHCHRPCRRCRLCHRRRNPPIPNCRSGMRHCYSQHHHCRSQQTPRHQMEMHLNCPVFHRYRHRDRHCCLGHLRRNPTSHRGRRGTRRCCRPRCRRPDLRTLPRRMEGHRSCPVRRHCHHPVSALSPMPSPSKSADSEESSGNASS